MNTVRRLLRYVWIMFPPAAHLPQAVAMFSSVYFALQALAGLRPLRLGRGAIAGGASVVLALLLVRLYDDVRDAPADAALARAGDPRYLARPTVTGLVAVSEVRLLCGLISALLLGINAAFGGARMLWVCAAGGAFTWLAFRWFFIPALAQNPPPLAHLARKSLTIVVGAYVAAVFADDWGAARLTPWTLPLLLAPCLESAAWEVSRKIRVPWDETAYATYSKMLGPGGAAALASLFVGLSLACLLPVARAAGLGWGYPAALVAVGAAAIGAFARFAAAPTRAGANLRPYSEWFGAVANGGLTIALGLRYGLIP